jgi:DNA-binding CsgD family transcriptional regulator
MTASAGYPFLVEEYCRSLLECKAIELGPEVRYRQVGLAPAVPRSLRHAVEARLAEVSADAAKIAELSAAIGSVIDFDLLQGLSGLGEDSILAALRELVREQLLSPAPSPREPVLAFRHALTRDAVLERLLPPERQLLHRRIAQVLEGNPETMPALLAYHWSRGGDKARAARYALQAGHQAVRLHAHREAISHYEVALAGGAEPRDEILTALGDQHAALGDHDPAVARYEEARQICRARSDITRNAELELRIGTCFANDRRRNEAISYLQSALTHLPTDHSERWRAGLWLALQLASRGDYSEALATLEEADTAVGRTVPIARLRIAYEIGGIRAITGDWAALAQAGTRALREASGDSDDALSLRHDAHAALGTLASYRGAFPAALEHFRASHLLADQLGQVVDRATADWNLAANVLHPLGRWAEARGTLAELAATAPRWLAAFARMLLLWQDGRWEDAADTARRSWLEFERNADFEMQHGFVRWLLEFQVPSGHLDEGLALVQPALDRMRKRGATGYAIRIVPYEAEAMVHRGDLHTRPILEAALDQAGRLGAQREVALLLRVRALANQKSGAWDEALADCDNAVTIFRGFSMPYEEAQTVRQAALLRLARGRRGDRERAATDLRTAQHLFAKLGAQRAASEVHDVIVASGLASFSHRPRPGLSARELAVAVAVAEGLTNAQIAACLYIAEDTVAHHVGSILNKLGVRSRAQIAAFVAQSHVLDLSNPRSLQR